MRRLRDWLSRFISADETLTAGLRRADRVRVEHPPDLTADKAARLWKAYLRSRRNKHLRRVVLNVLISPFTLLLVPLPGPNVIGFWFVYRAICHAQGYLGARRAQRGDLSLDFQASEALATPLPQPEIDQLAQAAVRLGPRSFERHFRKALDARTTTGPADRPGDGPKPTEARSGSDADVDRPRGLVASIPNALTISRLVMAVIFPWTPESWWLPLVVLAGLTEYLDGALSRWLRATSRLGQLLDPVADKMFTLAVLATLWASGILAGWMLPLIAARDLIVFAGAIWVFARDGMAGLWRMPPSRLGKVTTVAQYAFLLLTLATEVAYPGVLVATATIGLAAGFEYLTQFHRTPQLRARPGTRDAPVDIQHS